VVTTASAYQPNKKWAWYLGAILISELRVPLRAHYADDVLAGAALGYVTARWLLPSSAGEKQGSHRRSATTMPSHFVALSRSRRLSKHSGFGAAPYIEATHCNYGFMLTTPF
jgi:hypothetical protein